MDKQEIYSYFDKNNIPYTVVEHPAAFTVEEIHRLHLPRPESGAKNLFLRDDKKEHFFLFVIQQDKAVDLKILRAKAGTRRLSFASEDDLMRILQLRKGAVTPLGILNDRARAVSVFLDSAFRNGEICIHPNDNTASLYMETVHLEQLIRQHGNPIRYLDL